MSLTLRYRGNVLSTVFRGKLDREDFHNPADPERSAQLLAVERWGQVVGPDRAEAYYAAVRGTYEPDSTGDGRGQSTVEFRPVSQRTVITEGIADPVTGFSYLPVVP